MHLYWTGLVADLWRAGHRSSEWLLREAADGAIFAAGHAESGNDIPVLLSTTKAERVDGGYRYTGQKSFGSLTPVWSYPGVHGIDTSDPDAPRIVHGFLPRDTPGYTIRETWDTLGMRATYLDRIAQHWTDGVDHGAAGVVRIIGAKHHAVESSWRVVDRALDVAGGFGIFRRGPFEQLFRDARLGRIHPTNDVLTHRAGREVDARHQPGRDAAPG